MSYKPPVNQLSIQTSCLVTNMWQYIVTHMECDYRQVLDWWLDLLDTLEWMTIIYCTLLHTHPHRHRHVRTHTHTHTHVHSYVFLSWCLIAASNSGHSRDSGFPNYPRPQLPASDSNSSQKLNLSSSLIHWRTQSLSNQLAHLTPLDWTHTLPTLLLITSRHWPYRKHHPSVTDYSPLLSNSCCLVGSVLLPSNGPACYNILRCGFCAKEFSVHVIVNKFVDWLQSVIAVYYSN
jgi:hypothetical protein